MQELILKDSPKEIETVRAHPQKMQGTECL